jgi:hypothetical protein
MTERFAGVGDAKGRADADGKGGSEDVDRDVTEPFPYQLEQLARLDGRHLRFRRASRCARVHVFGDRDTVHDPSAAAIARSRRQHEGTCGAPIVVCEMERRADRVDVHTRPLGDPVRQILRDECDLRLTGSVEPVDDHQFLRLDLNVFGGHSHFPLCRASLGTDCLPQAVHRCRVRLTR